MGDEAGRRAAGGALRARRTRVETNQYYVPQRSLYRKASQRPGEVIWTDVYVFATSGQPGLNTAVARRPGRDRHLSPGRAVLYQSTDDMTRRGGFPRAGEYDSMLPQHMGASCLENSRSRKV